MSGNGGGSDDSWTKKRAPTATGGGEGGEEDVADPCDIESVTNLNSPNPALVASLKTGDVLSVRLLKGPPRILVAALGSRVAGSITSPEMPYIIACILRGVTYEADVLSVRGGICLVRVRR